MVRALSEPQGLKGIDFLGQDIFNYYALLIQGLRVTDLGNPESPFYSTSVSGAAFLGGLFGFMTMSSGSSGFDNYNLQLLE